MKESFKKSRWIFNVFPSLFNFWPLLLIFSQKALIFPGYFFYFYGRYKNYAKDIIIIISLLIFAELAYILQEANPYALIHLAGYSLFLLSIPIINKSVCGYKENLVKAVSFFTFFNSCLAILIYIFSIDISEYRGLNRIIGDDGVVARIFYESSSLIAVFSLGFVRNRFIKYIVFFVVLFYAIFLAKSIFVIGLYILNYGLGKIIKSKIWMKFIIAFLFVVVCIIIYSSLFYIRPDIGLSLSFKLNQLYSILNDDSSLILGSGWGYVIQGIGDSLEQPYQIEMQLPMLFRQIGISGMFFYVVGIFLLIKSVSKTWRVSFLRLLVYFAIGLNNPWLFLPSWYMTAVLMFQYLDDKK